MIKDKILFYLKANYKRILFITLLSSLCLKGIQSIWTDFKESIFQSELKQRGVSLEVEERILVRQIIKADQSSNAVLEEVKKLDYQTYKYEKLKENNIRIIDNNVESVKSPDSLLSIWRKR